MKRILLLHILFVSALLFTGCENGNEQTKSVYGNKEIEAIYSYNEIENKLTSLTNIEGIEGRIESLEVLFEEWHTSYPPYALATLNEQKVLHETYSLFQQFYV